MDTQRTIIMQKRGHGGNVHMLSRNNPESGRIIDFSANINPLGPPSWIRSVASRSLSQIIHYPDPDCYELVQTIAKKHNLEPQQIVPGNGTTEILYLLPRVLKSKRAVIPTPSYIDYKRVMELNDIEIELFHLNPHSSFELDPERLEAELQDNDVVFLGSPNNPTATVISDTVLLNLAVRNPSVWFIIDEAFLDFIPECESVAGKADNIITLHSLTKFYAIPGLRLGYGVFPLKISDALRKLMPPWTVNTLAQDIGKRMIADNEYALQTHKYLKEARSDLYRGLSLIKDFKIFESKANYFLVKILSGMTSIELQQMLLEQNLAIRVCDNYEGLDDTYFRIAVRTKEENNILLQTLYKCFKPEKNRVLRTDKKSKSLMIQGTSSNAGKSVIAAALCRILIQDGVRVAPFKAQNMSLNSFVTHDGLEMGRAQVVQAQAAKLDPDVRMNPVLLKPNSDVGSQVIVNGKPVGNMSVSEYYKYKDKAGDRARQSYDSLASEYDAIILEGAGSPGEVNLKSHDIVNMQMAKYANSPVILVGDIDRGGVYASFVGTMEVLEEWERQLVSGFLVNRFRGDATLLQSAHDYVLDHTGVPVVGTVPYIQELGIPEEDSVSFREGKLQKSRPQCQHVEIALISLPHISNFTDIEPFLDEPDVHLKIIESADDLDQPDSIIIPGSKNVMGDITFLNQSGIGAKICKLAEKNCEIVGICGGYIMLGKSIEDPHSIESDTPTNDGLNLLDIQTCLAKEKTLTRKSGEHIKSDLPVYGYEIHHGISQGGTKPLLKFSDGTQCGAEHPQLPIWGAYLHGIFDSDEFRRWYIDRLREKKGYEAQGSIMSTYNLEKAFDTLADVVRSSIDMNVVYKLLNI